jgi:hypothetical protein
MTRFIRIFASVALAAAWTPLAVNAMTATPLNQVQTQAHKSGPSILSKVQFNQSQSYSDPPFVQSGASNQKYPDSSGG